jgi:NAD(P)H-hydrate epimerase
MKIADADVAVPWLSTEQMVEVDRAMVEDLRIELIQMMENAGRNLAALARARFLGGDPRGRTVVVLAGPGGNGGGAMVAARRLHAWGARVEVFITHPDGGFTPVPAHQLEILRRMGVAVAGAAEVGAAPAADLVIDGIIGYSLHGAPRGAAAGLIRWAGAQRAPVLSLDVPSGIDATSGTVHEPAIRAAATMTLALPKHGLRADGMWEHVGELYLADIGVPPSLYAGEKLGLDLGFVFARNDIVRLS